MANDKVVFNQDGSYQRGDRVEDLDVKAAPKRRRSLQDVASAHIKTVGAPEPKTPQPGTFDLSALRKAAVKSSTTVEKTTLPPQGAAKFDKVEEVEIAPAQKTAPKSEEVPSMPAWSDSKSQELEDSVSDLLKPNEEETVVETPAESVVAEEPVAVVEEPKVPAMEDAAVVEKQVVKPIDLGSIKAASVVDETTSKGQPGADVAPVTVEALAVVEEPEKPEVVEAPKVSKEFSGNGFVVTALKDFLKQLSIDDFTFARWCRTCVSKAASMPATVFSASFNEDVRFYNFFQGKTAQWFGAVVGCGDNIVCIQVQTKSLVMQDSANSAIAGPDGFVRVNGIVVVGYEERLHKTRKV